MCLGVFPTKRAKMGTICFSEQKNVQAGNVSGGKYQVDGSQDSAPRLETENHSNLYIVVFANGLETVRVKWHIFKVLRNGLLRYILYTCPNL